MVSNDNFRGHNWSMGVLKTLKPEDLELFVKISNFFFYFLTQWCLHSKTPMKIVPTKKPWDFLVKNVHTHTTHTYIAKFDIQKYCTWNRREVCISRQCDLTSKVDTGIFVYNLTSPYLPLFILFWYGFEGKKKFNQNTILRWCTPNRIKKIYILFDVKHFCSQFTLFCLHSETVSKKYTKKKHWIYHNFSRYYFRQNVYINQYLQILWGLYYLKDIMGNYDELHKNKKSL